MPAGQLIPLPQHINSTTSQILRIQVIRCKTQIQAVQRSLYPVLRGIKLIFCHRVVRFHIQPAITAPEE